MSIGFTTDAILGTSDLTISIDCETNGLDFWHGVRPFIVVSTNAAGKTQLWQWDVDPLTREVRVNPDDVRDITFRLNHARTVILHNSKFDAHALDTVGITLPWDKVEDTLCAGHVLASSDPHDLTSMARAFVSEDLARRSEALEVTLAKHVKSARNFCRHHLPTWKTASTDDPNLPSAKGSGDDGPWHNDYWLPYTVAQFLKANPDHHQPNDWKGWDTNVREYAISDSATTVMLWAACKRALENRGLWKTYRARFEGVPVAYRMENHGPTVHGEVLDEAEKTYGGRSNDLGCTVLGIAASMGYDLELPKKGTNQSLDDFVFGRAPREPDALDANGKVKRGKRLPGAVRTASHDTLNLQAVEYTETGAPSFNADARITYLGTLKPTSKAHLFVKCLSEKADLDAGLSYLAAYRRFALPAAGSGECPGCGITSPPDYRQCPACGSPIPVNRRMVIHPNLNPFGTDTLRWSSNNPNSQNISKQSAVNLRKCFGPGPGREWYSLDAENIELRIPAYECGEKELTDVFDRPNDAPYFGSYHLVIFDTLHPLLFKEHGKACKTLFEDTWYQWVKNGNFARQYGAQEALVDATYRVAGGYKKIASRFPKIDALNRHWIEYAQKNGYVETIPDRSVDPDRGYPLLVKRGQWGKVKPTTPFCYHVSGTACQWMNRAMVRCDRVVEDWRRNEGFDARMVLTVHDELVFDLPRETRFKVISGGQTGADQAGLRAAKAMGHPTGGSITRGWKTLDGPNPKLAEYGLVELASDFYNVRTYKNVEDADVTLRFASHWGSPGEKCTLNAIRSINRPYFDIDVNRPCDPGLIRDFFLSRNVSTVNVAGNSEQTSPGIGKFVEKFLKGLFEMVSTNLPRVRELQRTMASCGDDIGVPTPVSVSYHPVNWAEEIKL